ncbi:MAG: hypothetical protein M1833_005083 [Piccolia ochrophora]|nr:MAG: hypothetical protein M1833_005083 [Piccolia ochrophora]
MPRRKKTGVPPPGHKEPSPPPVKDTRSKPLQLPPDFKPSAAASSPEVLEILSPENLQGKQLWHIVAPASVPVTSIKEFAMESLENEGTVMSHGGEDFAFTRTTHERAPRKKVLIPKGRTGKYEFAPMEISQTLQLHQVVQPPDFDNVRKHLDPEPRFPQQPKGLKQRFFPLGFGPGPDDSASNED